MNMSMSMSMSMSMNVNMNMSMKANTICSRSTARSGESSITFSSLRSRCATLSAAAAPR